MLFALASPASVKAIGLACTLDSLVRVSRRVLTTTLALLATEHRYRHSTVDYPNRPPPISHSTGRHSRRNACTH